MPDKCLTKKGLWSEMAPPARGHKAMVFEIMKSFFPGICRLKSVFDCLYDTHQTPEIAREASLIGSDY